MNTTIVPSPYNVLISELLGACRAWQAAKSINGHDVDILTALVHICGFAHEYSGHADFICLEHEIHEAAKAFLAKDFPECERHFSEADAWKKAIDREVADARAKRHKTPVR